MHKSTSVGGDQNKPDFLGKANVSGHNVGIVAPLGWRLEAFSSGQEQSPASQLVGEMLWGQLCG